MTHAHHASPTRGDLAYETFFSAAVGGSAIALFFLVSDSLMGQPFYTPSVLGSALFFGTSPAEMTAVRMDAVALLTAVHFVAFAALGFVAAVLVRAVERVEAGFLASVAAVLVVIEVGFLASAALLMPGVIEHIGQGHALAANTLTAVSMTASLRRAHVTAELEDAAPGLAAEA